MKTMLDKHPGLSEHIDEVIVGNVIGGRQCCQTRRLKSGFAVGMPGLR